MFAKLLSKYYLNILYHALKAQDYYQLYPPLR